MFKFTEEEFKKIFPFDAPRNNQRELIEQIIDAYNNGKKYVILNAPTGIGKSVIGYSVAKWFGSSYILTSQKILQEQYYRDYKIPYVLGRVNYQCQKNPAMNCELGACFNIPHKRCYATVNGCKQLTCPYVIEKNRCINSLHSNLNYSYFLTLFGDDHSEDSHRDLVVCDEVHNLEAELINQCTVKVDEKLLKVLGVKDIKLPGISVADGTKCHWLFNEFFDNITSQFLYLVSQMKQLSEMKSTKEYKKIAARYSLMKRLIESIKLMQKMHSNGEEIVVTQQDGVLEYKALHCNKMFEQLLDDKADRFLFMSASILDYKTFVQDIGVDMSLVEYIECDSVFPVENRLIHYAPVGSMSYKTKNKTMPDLIRKVEKILKANKNVKGIIHTVNYDIAERIVDALSFSDQSDRLLMPKGSNKQTLLNIFYTSNKPYVLISPSLTEGIDLKEDLSRLCIICKVPYASLADKWTVKRMEENRRWYISQACMHLVQMTGRSIRSETDFATTYILDEDFIKLAQGAMDIFPKWWKEAVIID